MKNQGSDQMSRQIVEKSIHIGLLLGFLVLAIGVLFWLSELSARLDLGLSTSLIVGGAVLLMLGLLAMKLVTAVD